MEMLGKRNMDIETFFQIARTGVEETDDKAIVPYYHYSDAKEPTNECTCGNRRFYRYGNLWKCSFSVLALEKIDQTKELNQ